MSPHCFADEALGELLELAAGDPRRSHLEQCPRCRARLAQYRDFLAANPEVSGARVSEARDHLDQALAREIGLSSATHVAPSGERDPFLARIARGLGTPVLRPAYALAALAIVVGGAWLTIRGREPSVRALRGESPSGPLTLAAPRALEDGALELSWSPMTGADRYQVKFFAPDLSDLAKLEPLPGTRAVLRRAALPAGLGPGKLVMWQVVALRGRDTIGASRTAPLRLP